jgi:hypothetical protein
MTIDKFFIIYLEVVIVSAIIIGICWLINFIQRK